MKILLCSRLAGHGGVAVYNRTLARALIDDGHDVSIVTSDDKNASSWRREDREGVPTILIPSRMPRLWRRLPILRHYARSWNHWRYSQSLDTWLRSLAGDERPDVIEFAEVGGEGYHYTRRKNRSPVVVRCHTPSFILRKHHADSEMRYDTNIVVRMEKSCIRCADLLTTPSVDMAQVVSNETGLPMTRFRPIANAVDVEMVRTQSPGPELDSIPENAVVILHVGRLERVKGIKVLADAIPGVIQACPNAYFVFIGQPRVAENGRMWDQLLREQFDQEGVSGRVRILNYVENSVMNRWYLRADLAVVPSLNYESFSYTCAQAMAAGLPVVASAIGGIPETLDRGSCGILVPLSDSPALAKALIELVENPKRRMQMGIRGRERADSCFSAPVVARQMTKVYDEAIGIHRCV